MIISETMSVRGREVRNIHEKRSRNSQIRSLSINLTSFLKILNYQDFEGRVYCESMFFLICYFHTHQFQKLVKLLFN